MVSLRFEDRQPVHQSAVHLEKAGRKVEQITENVRQVVANTLRVMVVLAETQKGRKELLPLHNDMITRDTKQERITITRQTDKGRESEKMLKGRKEVKDKREKRKEGGKKTKNIKGDLKQ